MLASILALLGFICFLLAVAIDSHLLEKSSCFLIIAAFIVVTCTEQEQEQDTVIESATSVQIDTIYTINKADTVVTYNITYTK